MVCRKSRREFAFLVPALLAIAAPAWADEGGASFWLPGQYSTLIAVPPEPGWSLPVTGYYYSGNASASKTFPIGISLVAGLDAKSVQMFVAPTYAPETKFLGGQAAFNLAWAYGGVKVDTDLAISPFGVSTGKSQTTWGGSDLYPFASLSWASGVNNWMTYITGDIPVGAYDSKRLANVGLGHGAVDAGGAYTYLDTASGREFSAAAGVTYNLRNSSTDYRSGIDSHLDWGATQFLSASVQVGLAGYVYYQLTDDSGGASAQLNGFKSRVAGIGPQMGYFFDLGGAKAYLNLRGYWEFWAQNRTEGYSLFATISIPLGAKPAKT